MSPPPLIWLRRSQMGRAHAFAAEQRMSLCYVVDRFRGEWAQAEVSSDVGGRCFRCATRARKEARK
jgi:hypothetical protein